MKELVINEQSIQNKIFTVRGKQVMLDEDLAEIYGVETKYLNRAVKRNIERFPESFRFQLTEEEYKNLRFQFGTSKISKSISELELQTAPPKKRGGRRYLPYVFTEQGVSMLSAVLHSETAIQVSIRIINAFVNMRKFILENAAIFQRLEYIDQRLLGHDENFDKLFKALESKGVKHKQGIFFDGQIFDAYLFLSDLVKSSKKSIMLIDNYVDETVLTLFSKNKKAKVNIYTKNISKQLKLDLNKYNSQYKPIEIKKFNSSHDRFLIIDDQDVYHFGASLKDLGKKWFAFSKFDINAIEILGKLEK
ncbi:MAG: ORF6N domain-containing protein [Ignavibacteriae bacterium]|nr:ORF6N domain-containing protein [Ignavibacteriota bacterium]NOG98228.1 ORF6N domain-containing protein [Ignavibacteriota bacterium]